MLKEGNRFMLSAHLGILYIYCYHLEWVLSRQCYGISFEIIKYWCKFNTSTIDSMASKVNCILLFEKKKI